MRKQSKIIFYAGIVLGFAACLLYTSDYSNEASATPALEAPQITVRNASYNSVTITWNQIKMCIRDRNTADHKIFRREEYGVPECPA